MEDGEGGVLGSQRLLATPLQGAVRRFLGAAPIVVMVCVMPSAVNGGVPGADVLSSRLNPQSRSRGSAAWLETIEVGRCFSPR